MPATQYYGTGRRKTAAARVYLTAGSGAITINKRPIDEFFGRQVARMIVRQPLQLVDVETKFDVNVSVEGGGSFGQAGFRQTFNRLYCKIIMGHKAFLFRVYSSGSCRSLLA